MSAPEDEDVPLRPMGHFERFNIVRNYLKMYNNFQVSATYTIPRTLLPSPDLTGLQSVIYSALRDTLQSQPVMNVVISDEETPIPKWQRLETIDFRNNVKFIDRAPASNPDEWISAGHASRLDRVDEIPLWRIIVASQESDLTSTDSSNFSFHLAFYVHHVIADGLSCAAFHRTFLSSLNTIISHPTITPSPLLRPSKTLSLLPTLEAATPLPISLWYALKQILKAFIYNPPDPLSFTGPLIPPSTPQITSNLRTISLQPPTVQSLLRKCREEKTTITALITVLAARKLASMHPEKSHFTCSIPCSMRRFMTLPDRAMGMFVSPVKPSYASEPNPPRGFISCASPSSPKPSDEDGNSDADLALWESARQTRDVIARGTASNTDQMVGMLKFVRDYRGFFLGLLGRKREHAFEVTNIGVVDGGAELAQREEPGDGEGVEGGEGGERVGKERAWFDHLVFSSDLCVYGDPFCVSIVSAKGGDMTVAVNWVSGVTDEGEARALSAFLEERLRALGG